MVGCNVYKRLVAMFRNGWMERLSMVVWMFINGWLEVYK